MKENPNLTEQYRPKTISDCVLPNRLKDVFQQFVDDGEFPNLLLTGSPGVGKTTVATALMDELGFDHILVNGSMESDIGTLRSRIKQFASTLSLVGGRKCVIFDEADYLNAQSTQPALRRFMEDFSSNCGFILTCNYPRKIIEPLHSRCSVIEFALSGDEKIAMGKQFISWIISILDEKGITYDEGALADLVAKHLPDWRRILNELQRYSATGSIDDGILTTLDASVFDGLMNGLKQGDVAAVRRWVRENTDVEPLSVFEALDDAAPSMMSDRKTADLTKIVARYQFQSTTDVIQRINTTGCLIEVMDSCFNSDQKRFGQNERSE